MVRIGGPHDGGYVIADALSRVRRCLTFGVGADVSFEQELAIRGISSILFDHTVSGLPRQHSRMVHLRQPWREPESGIESIAPADGDILKFDVEGDEWPNLAALGADQLCRFTHIIGEFHDCETMWSSEALDKLTTHHNLIHVHGNNYGTTFAHDGKVWNYGTTFAHDGKVWPSVIEMTFARKDLCQFVPHEKALPLVIDSPNCPSLPEITIPILRP